MLNKRLIISLIMGAILGVFCIIGASVRNNSEITFLFSLWYNRVVIGLAIGLAPSFSDVYKLIIRGAILGLLVSFAFYATTGFSDVVSFLAGIVYGIIIEYVLYVSSKKEIK